MTETQAERDAVSGCATAWQVGTLLLASRHRDVARCRLLARNGHLNALRRCPLWGPIAGLPGAPARQIPVEEPFYSARGSALPC